MGLDMYLNAKKFTSWSSDPEDAVPTANGVPEADGMKLTYLNYEGMYWRKANAIHHWFVENVQDGEDNCMEYCVSFDDLMELMELCAEVIANPDKAAELLPPQGGFFFGAAEVDGYYWEQVKRTHKELKELLSRELGDEWRFTYQSSW
jgi:hypothetical protein